MALDQPPVAGSAVPQNGAANGTPVSPRARLRIRFEKAGDLRFVSHHDLMHCFERMFRRAALPVRASQGFNPKPRLVFALSLALGLVGRAEVLEVELAESLSPEDVHERLARQAPAGLTIHSVRAIDPKTRVQVRRAVYRIEIPAERRAELPDRIAEFLAADACWIERTRPHQRRIDLRPYVCELRLDDNILDMVFWVTPQGAARPEEVLGRLGLDDLIEAGGVIERSYLELHDEVSGAGASVAAAPVPTFSEQFFATESSNTRGQQPESRLASRPTALIPGPLSFES